MKLHDCDPLVTLPVSKPSAQAGTASGPDTSATPETTSLGLPNPQSLVNTPTLTDPHSERSGDQTTLLLTHGLYPGQPYEAGSPSTTSPQTAAPQTKIPTIADKIAALPEWRLNIPAWYTVSSPIPRIPGYLAKKSFDGLAARLGHSIPYSATAQAQSSKHASSSGESLDDVSGDQHEDLDPRGDSNPPVIRPLKQRLRKVSMVTVAERAEALLLSAEVMSGSKKPLEELIHSPELIDDKMSRSRFHAMSDKDQMKVYALSKMQKQESDAAIRDGMRGLGTDIVANKQLVDNSDFVYVPDTWASKGVPAQNPLLHSSESSQHGTSTNKLRPSLIVARDEDSFDVLLMFTFGGEGLSKKDKSDHKNYIEIIDMNDMETFQEQRTDVLFARDAGGSPAGRRSFLHIKPKTVPYEAPLSIMDGKMSSRSKRVLDILDEIAQIERNKIRRANTDAMLAKEDKKISREEEKLMRESITARYSGYTSPAAPSPSQYIRLSSTPAALPKGESKLDAPAKCAPNGHGYPRTSHESPTHNAHSHMHKYSSNAQNRRDSLKQRSTTAKHRRLDLPDKTTKGVDTSIAGHMVDLNAFDIPSLTVGTQHGSKRKLGRVESSDEQDAEEMYAKRRRLSEATARVKVE